VGEGGRWGGGGQVLDAGHIARCAAEGRTLTARNAIDGGELHDGALPQRQPRAATRRPALLLEDEGRFATLLGSGPAWAVPGAAPAAAAPGNAAAGADEEDGGGPTLGSHRALRIVG
jgi:hypothetical protein